MIAISLKKGLLLENISLRLPWGANYSELREIGGPEIRVFDGRGVSPRSYLLIWRDAMILSGIKAVVSTHVRGPQTRRPKYYGKRMAWLRIDVDRTHFSNARQEYRWLLQMLMRR